MGTARRAFALALPLLAACFTTGPEDVTEQRLREADALYDSGLYPESIRYYQYVTEKRPILKRAFIRMAHSYQMCGEPFVALHWYEHIRDTIDSKDISVLHNLSELYYETGFLPESSDSLKAILEINPHDLGAREALRMVIAHMSTALAEPAPAVKPAAPAITPAVPAIAPPTPAPAPSTAPPADKPAVPVNPMSPGGGFGESKTTPAVDPPAPSPVEGLAAADAEIRDAAVVARRLAENPLPADAAGRAAVRTQTIDAGNRLRAAVQKYREAMRRRPEDPALQRKVAMAERVLGYLDDLLRELGPR